MFEIKITGNTAEEIRKDLNELTTIFGGEIKAQKSSKAESKKAEKEVKENDQDTNDTKDKKSTESATSEENSADEKEPDDEHTNADDTKETSDDGQATYTLEEVRAKAAALQRAGKRDLVKSVITGAGASKLTEVDPSKYAWMMQCFEAGEVIE